MLGCQKQTTTFCGITKSPCRNYHTTTMASQHQQHTSPGRLNLNMTGPKKSRTFSDGMRFIKSIYGGRQTMTLLIILAIIIYLCIPKQKPKRNNTRRIKTYTKPAPIDPVKAQRERERQADRARKEAERQRKEAERAKKEQEEKQAAQDRIEWAGAMIDKYSALYEQIETELNDNPGLTEYKRIQLQKQLLQLEEKIYKYREQQNKAYYTANK